MPYDDRTLPDLMMFIAVQAVLVVMILYRFLIWPETSSLELKSGEELVAGLSPISSM